MVKDYYQILKLKRNASTAEINKAYHQQQQAWSNYLNTADSKGRLKAKQMLKELAMAKTALLKTKGYQGNQRPSPRRQTNRQEIFLVKWFKRGSNIIVKGVQGATISILGIVIAVIWKLGEIAFRILATIFLGCLFILGLVILAVQGLACNYISMGVVTFVVYSLDKRKARLGLWRIPEKQLHYLELIGGWLGAFCAQVSLPHKSSKASYQRVYWLIVFFHLSLLLLFVPPSFSYAIPQKYILVLNVCLLSVSFVAIKQKGEII
ncbi:MAG: hypothetical protein RLZZ04_3203 [Cyanobacteriota bacterium]